MKGWVNKEVKSQGQKMFDSRTPTAHVLPSAKEEVSHTSRETIAAGADQENDTWNRQKTFYPMPFV